MGERAHRVVLGLLGVVVVTAYVLPVLCGTAEAAVQETSYEWSINLDCIECHATQASVFKGGETADRGSTESENTESEGLAADGYAIMHVEELGLACTTCHTDTEGLAAGHKKLNSGKEAKRLRKSSVADEVCLACHDSKDVADRTAESEVLTDKNGMSVNPHDLPSSDNHEDIVCTDCHQVHEETSITESSMAVCAGCHHAEVFECGTCHE